MILWTYNTWCKQTKLNKYLDDTNLLEEVTDFLNCDIFSKSLYENGVVVRVVLLSSCGKDQERKVSDDLRASFHSDENEISLVTLKESYLVHPLSRSLESL